MDAVGSLAIGVLLVMIAIVLAIEMASLLVGEAAAPEVVERMRNVFDAHPEVSCVIALRTQHVGPDDIMVNAKLEFDPSLSMARLAAVVNELEVELRSRGTEGPHDLHRTGRVPGSGAATRAITAFLRQRCATLLRIHSLAPPRRGGVEGSK